ncbi:MAG TPA: hypothetical protein VGH30_12075 [Jatrophihabitantaceae bacterium]|jgi:hypothetical protein
MNIAAVRRLSLAGIGLIGTAAITVACSSSTSGTGVPPTNAATSVSVPSSLPPVSIPASASIPSLPASGIPTLSGSKFCTDLSKLGNLGSSLSGGAGDLSKLVSGLDALVAEAPAQIKPDVQVLDQYVKDAANGKIDTNLATKITTAAEHIETYLAANCHP